LIFGAETSKSGVFKVICGGRGVTTGFSAFAPRIPNLKRLWCQKRNMITKTFWICLTKRYRNVGPSFEKKKFADITKFKSDTLWHLEMSPNVTLFQIFGTKLRLPFMFGFFSE